jgi:excinuclease UvrABC ATPase subunit
LSQEYITVRGARENNLKNISLRIPKRKITVFAGVSESGKSSIVFDTIAAEARRQLNETVIVIEHNQAIIKQAAWIIDMGPEGGNRGGRVIFEGTPQELLDCKQSLTGAYLRNRGSPQPDA